MKSFCIVHNYTMHKNVLLLLLLLVFKFPLNASKVKNRRWSEQVQYIYIFYEFNKVTLTLKRSLQ